MHEEIGREKKYLRVEKKTMGSLDGIASCCAT